jgi:hypothetical protein
VELGLHITGFRDVLFLSVGEARALGSALDRVAGRAEHENRVLGRNSEEQSDAAA